jgi:2-dehydro-3-deoxy-D-arabinonate dehydratase
MTPGLFRLQLADGEIRLASGSVEGGPEQLLAAGLTIESILREGVSGLGAALRDEAGEGRPVPEGARLLAPVDSQEVWAAGVTYERSRDARMEESTEASVYDHVYGADRPELFFKAAGWRVRGPGDSVGIRADSDWDVPEPELALVVTPDLDIAGYTIGNDVSSRTIEGENPLYLPQAKVYDGSCSLGPALVPASAVSPPFTLRLVIVRHGAVIVDESTTTARIRRPLTELVGFLGRALDLPSGAILLTGTGIVPAAPFSLLHGDVVRIDAGPLGILENPVVTVGGERSERRLEGVGTVQGAANP